MTAFLVLGSIRSTSVGHVCTQVPQPMHPFICSIDISNTFWFHDLATVVYLRTVFGWTTYGTWFYTRPTDTSIYLSNKHFKRSGLVDFPDQTDIVIVSLATFSQRTAFHLGIKAHSASSVGVFTLRINGPTKGNIPGVVVGIAFLE